MASAPSLDGVQLLDARTLAGRRVPHLFLPALEDGRVPNDLGAPSLLPEEVQRRLQRALARDIFRVRAGEERPGWQAAIAKQ